MMQAGTPLTLAEINELEIKYTDIFGNESFLKRITIPLHFGADELQLYTIKITPEALFDMVHLAQSRGLHLSLNKV